MPKYLTCVPSYGRDYKSAAAVKADWMAGKDFQIVDSFSPEDGRQINREDAERTADNSSDTLVLNIRYKGLANICQIKVKPGDSARPAVDR